MIKEVIDTISETLGIDKKEIKKDTNLAKDLNLDSLDLVDLVAAFEKKYKCEIPDKDVKQFQTVQDIVDYINSKNV